MTRIYLPATMESLAAWHAAGTVPASAERFTAPDESEDGEYAALLAATEASADLLAAPTRRVVLVAEVDDEDGPALLRQVVAVHADSHADADPDDDLGWYATQEIPHLLDGTA